MRRRSLLNQHGFSLVESIIAAVILVVTILLVARMVMNFKGTSRVLEGNSSCHTRAEAALSAFKSLDNKTVVNNFQPCPNCNPTPSVNSTSNLTHPERFGNNSILLAPPSGSDMTYDKTNTWMLIDNGVNLALNLYNQKKIGGPGAPDFCKAPIQFDGTGAFSPSVSQIATNPTLDLKTVLANVGPSLDQEKDFLQVQLYDLTTGQNVPCGSTSYLSPGYTLQRILPLGAQNGKPPTPLPETKLGIKVKSIVQFVNQTGVQEQCTADTALRADGNTAGPLFLWDPERLFADQFTNFPYYFSCPSTNPYVCMGIRAKYGQPWNYLDYPLTGQNPPHVFCGNSSTAANVHFAVAVNEPAVTFGCYFSWSPSEVGIDSATGVSGYTPPVNPTPSAPGAFFQPCSGGTFTTPRGTFSTTMTQVTIDPAAVPLPTRPPFTNPSSYTAATGNVTAAEITATGLPDGWYTIYIRAFDSAQNETTVAQEFGVDNTRPDKMTPTGGTYNFVPPPYIHYSPTAPAGLYQCQDSNNAQFWTVKVTNSSGIPEIAPTGAIWNIDGASVNNGKCNSAGLVAQGLKPGVHTVSAQPCDTCLNRPGGGPLVPAYPALTQKWTIDLSPGCPTPTPAPSVSPSPSPTPTPTPFACCLGGGALCTGTGGYCSWGTITTTGFYAMGGIGGVVVPPGGPIPNPAGADKCNNQPNCAVAPNAAQVFVCEQIYPCPVLLQPLATCNFDYECASNSCVTRTTGPASKQCQ